MTRLLRLPSTYALLLALSVGGLGARDLAADAPAGDVTVPDFVGLELTSAQQLSEAAGIQCQPVFGAPGTPGRVVSQDPGGLAVRPASTPIRITVAGPDPGISRQPAPARTPVAPPTPAPVQPTPPAPEVPPAPPTPSERPPIDPPAGTGTSPLETAPALPPPEMPPAEAPTVPAEPPPTAPTPGGIDINALTVEPLPSRQGPMVPVVLGQTVDQARQSLSRWKVTVELMLADASANGRVVEQHPRPTTNLAEGEQLTLVVGTTAAPADSGQVPALVGKSVDDAVAALKKAGFQPALRAAPSTGAERGQVLRQTPQRYSFAARGSEVRLTVGLGGAAGTAPASATPRPPAPSEMPPAPETPVPPVEEPAPAAPEPPAPTPPPSSSPPRAAPGPTTLVGPADGENYPRAHGATFEWRTVPNADGYQWELEIQAGTAWRAAQAEKLIGTKFRPARLEAGRYRWRVRALIGETPGAWTDFRLLYLY